MDYRYYYDAVDFDGEERRDRTRRRTRDIVAAGAVAGVVAALGQAFGVIDGHAVALPCALAAVLSFSLHRPVLRLLRGDGVIVRPIGAR